MPLATPPGSILDRLSRQESRVFELVLRGLTNPEIASQLKIATSTAKNHVSAVLRKLEVSNRTEAVGLASAFELRKPTSGIQVDSAAATGMAGCAVGVLAFHALDDDRRSQDLACGLAEDLTTAMSQSGWFPVIAQSTMRRYGEQPADLPSVASQSGARYLVEGAVRVQGRRAQVNYAVIEGASGHRLWSDDYRCALGDILELQREVARTLAHATHHELLLRESHLTAVLDPEPGDAWTLAMRGRHLSYGRDRTDNHAAREHFLLAVDSDPNLALGWHGLAFSHHRDMLEHWTHKPESSAAQFVKAAQRCWVSAPNHPETEVALAYAAMYRGERRQAMQHLDSALARDPNSAVGNGLLGQLLAMDGDPAEGIAYLELARRLNPDAATTWRIHTALGLVHFAANNFCDSTRAGEAALASHRHAPFALALIAASRAHAGDLEGARARGAELKRVHPGFRADVVRVLGKSALEDQVERFLEGLRRAGAIDSTEIK